MRRIGARAGGARCGGEPSDLPVAGNVVCLTSIALALGRLTAVLMGVTLAHCLPARTLRSLFFALMLVTALVLAPR